MARLEPDPECVLAITDIQVFGLLEKVEQQHSICGTAAERVRKFMATHFDGTASRPDPSARTRGGR